MKDTKKLLLTAGHWHCSHGHNGLVHPACWERFVESTADEFRVGYFDIEATNLKADFGIMLSYAFKERGETGKIISNVIQQSDINSLKLDKPLVAQCLEDMKKFDMIVTYFGTGYDLPFVRTRALKWNLPFPEYGALIHLDLYYVVRAKLSLSRKSLENVGKLIGVGELKNHLEPDIWTQALLSKKARDYILDHNERDVILLEKAHDRLSPYIKGIRRSV